MTSSASRRTWLIAALLAVMLGLGGLQVWSAIATRDVVDRALSAQGPIEAAALEREKARQEIIGKTIENHSKALLETNLVSALGAGLGLVISVSGGLIALFGYFDARDKDRKDRAEAEEKARTDRLTADDKASRDRAAAALGDTLGRLASGDARQRAVGAAGLLPFFTPERAEFHLQALAALATLAKWEDEPGDVHESVRVAMEQAGRSVGGDLLRKLSWRGAQLDRVDLRGCDLSGIDLRDASLRDSDLQGCSLVGANLAAAKLQGARLAGADLGQARLSYADLAGADLKGASFVGASIDNIGVLNTDLEGADFRALAGGWRGTPWDATRNWRRAKFDDDVRRALDGVYGEELPPLRVLMLLWEAPPFVAGGTWTAAYHLVRKLRRRGADVTVVTPWRRDLLDDNPFGLDIPLVGLGVTPPRNAGPGGYDTYGSYSTYASSAGGFTGAYGSYGVPGLLGSVVYVLMDEFRSRLLAYLAENTFDLVHAHDWVTFGAAQAAADLLGRAWIAHFHSTEEDRNPETPDLLTHGIEQAAVRRAFSAVVPSEATKQVLVRTCRASPKRIAVVPNSLSEEPVGSEDIGGFEARKVVFVGRLVAQKGFDRFVTLAADVRRLTGPASFEAFGAGRLQIPPAGVRLHGQLAWSLRGGAFSEASVVVLPSRSEPFGMVVLEAMAHRTPIIYPRDSGAAEVLKSGLRIDPADRGEMARSVARLLDDGAFWETTVRAQAADVQAYAGRSDEDLLVEIWRRAAAAVV